MTEEFDFDKALKALQSGQAIIGKNGVLTPIRRQLTWSYCLTKKSYYGSPMHLTPVNWISKSTVKPVFAALHNDHASGGAISLCSFPQSSRA